MATKSPAKDDTIPRQSPAYRTGRPRYNRGLHRIINSANAGAVAVIDCEGPQTGVSRETVRRWCLAEHLSRLPHKGDVIEFWCNGGEVAEQARRHHWERVRVGPNRAGLGQAVYRVLQRAGRVPLT